jgi:MraZ protein
MFIGEYNHSIDDKGRLSVPVKFRDLLATGCVLTRGLDGCLWLYPQKDWEEIAGNIAALPVTQKNARSFARFILSGAMDLKVDKIGRINVPKYLSDYAGIKSKAVVIGMHNRLEIWAEEKWREFSAEMEAKSEETAETLVELGF